MCLPPVKYNPKRELIREKKGKKSDVHCDPSHWKCVEALQGSQMSKISSSKSPSSHLCRKSLRNLYVSQFPIFPHDYI